jgi:signal transduction histidine kinase/ligand-binding sensor domain-containing protein
MLLPRSLAQCALAFAVVAAPLPAATFLAEGYAVRVWQTEDGLPQNMVTSAVQTRDGYLWFGTYSGLARFDGGRFEVFDPANTPGITDRRIACLFADAQDRLWIGHEAGVVTRYERGHFEPYTQSSGRSGEKVIGLGADEQGRVWAMRGDGAIDSLQEKGRRISSLITPALPSVMGWAAGAGGNLWVAENGLAARLTDGALEVATFPAPRQDNYVLGIGAAAGGGAWVLCDGRIRKWQDGRWTEDRGDFPWPTGPLACGLELHDGTLAIGTIYSGLYLVYGDGRPPTHIDRPNGLPQSWVRFLYEDRERNLWLGTGSAGLVSIHATPFSILNAPDQWQGCTVLSVAAGRDGSLWIGTDGATLYQHAAGKWTHYGEAEGLGNGYVPAVATTAEGTVWVGQFWWGSPFRLENGRFIRPPGVDDRMSPVFALLPNSPDELLVGARDGLMKLQSGRATWLAKSPSGSAGAACAIARDSQGGVWCGFEEGGLAHIVDGKVTIFRRQDGIASDAIRSLLVDDDGALWIGTADAGLSRYKQGRFANLGVTQGVADKVICKIVDDGRGYYWLSTHHGLQRVAKDQLNRCADGAIPAVVSQVYDQSDGLPTVEFVGGLQASACKSPDGRLWFATSKGVVAVDPARIEPNPHPPPVVIESPLVDGKVAPVSAGVVTSELPPNHERLEIPFAGLSFVAPAKVRFRYRLDGIDNNWVDAGPQRTAFYSRLSAGTYRFRVVACNNDGLWNDEGASLTFTVAPFFWQTWWFISLCGVGAISGVAWGARAVTRRRLQRRMEQLEREHAVERERSRIAQDIHDDIGASVTRITMLSQPRPDQLANPQQTSVVLSRIGSAARDVTRALDEIVWAVDPRHDTLDSLVGYMGAYAQDLLAAANIRCRLDFPPRLPAWPVTAEVRHHVFLAFKEALNNAVKHAAATEVHISLELGPDGFVLAVEDNGRGLEASPANASATGRTLTGHGLPNLQRRLARIGGRCEVSSQPETGTRIAFVVDVRKAARPTSPAAVSNSAPPPTA